MSAAHNAWLVDIGHIGYADACALQQRIAAARKADALPDVLLFVEHPHVITLGRNASPAHILASEPLLRQMNVEFHATDRGGDVTYHGPGQVVGYPIVKLSEIRRDVAWYVRALEEAMIRASAEFGVAAIRREGKTGVWVETRTGDAEKLAAIGVHLSRWVTSHGFAYNVATDLRYFDLIVPCGISGCRATSLEKLLARAVRPAEVAPRIAAHLGEVLGLEFHSVAGDELEAALESFDQSPVAAPAGV